MYRADRAVTHPPQIKAVIEACKICRIAMVDEGTPYLVPLNFGYELKQGELTLYFHSAKKGKKLDVLQKDNHVCFEMDAQGQLLLADSPCDYGYPFASIIGFGTVAFVEDTEEKCNALSALMQHQTGDLFSFNATQASHVCVYKIVTNHYTCKQRKI